jgi:hypothetical protein
LPDCAAEHAERIAKLKSQIGLHVKVRDKLKADLYQTGLSCNLLAKKQNRFYHDYKVIVAAGSAAGIGVAALPPLLEATGDPVTTKTITLSCGKLTTVVTVKPWTGILMLRNSSSPEMYFQTAFRVQSPWTVQNPDGASPNSEQIIKKDCYVFDFAPDRALRQIADYSCRLNINEGNPEKRT